ncbi:hypothetical protein [Streptomyces bambusae]|uniref:Secreted protein n=1 Tax=Streptomyces bambusae TaxID=1550616 RepID=A0ABS6Z454_9ACTN|nr:hypothetical protein [Streptomyces bambusae]MBW5482543.1 hypothetical protein [Streptomyces bambusae]
MGAFPAGLALALTAIAALAAAPAQAATGGCRGQLVHTVSLPSGELRVYRTRTEACAVTVALRPGPRRPLSVTIQPRGGVPVTDAGDFTRYAGPVTVHTVTRCVHVRGASRAESVESGWILC